MIGSGAKKKIQQVSLSNDTIRRRIEDMAANVSTLEKECVGIVWGITKFRFYLTGKPFILQTDHQRLAYINKTKYQNDRIMRWALA